MLASARVLVLGQVLIEERPELVGERLLSFGENNS